MAVTANAAKKRPEERKENREVHRTRSRRQEETNYFAIFSITLGTLQRNAFLCVLCGFSRRSLRLKNRPSSPWSATFKGAYLAAW
jgi:hypothetical protein